MFREYSILNREHPQLSVYLSKTGVNQRHQTTFVLHVAFPTQNWDTNQRIHFIQELSKLKAQL